MWFNRIFIGLNNKARHPFRIGITALCLCLAAAVCCQPVSAQGKPIKDKTKRDFDNNCMRSGCHGGLNETAWVHGPVAVGSCDICHKESGPKEDHKFSLLREKEKVCTYCHQGNVTGKVVHKIVTDEGCLKCHNPHGGVKRNLLLVQDEFKLCTECHKPQYYSMKQVAASEPAKSSPLTSPLNTSPATGTTTPAPGKATTATGTTTPATGKAASAPGTKTPATGTSATPSKTEGPKPAPEAKPAPKSILAATATVPLTHGVKKEDLKKMDLRKYQFVHKPITEGKCLSCHDAHSSDHKGLLPVEERELCTTCHKDWKEFKKSGLTVHTPAKKDCLSCHMKHGGNVSKLLVRQPRDLCLSCHTHVDTSIKTGMAYKIEMVPEEKAEAGDLKAEAGDLKAEAGDLKPEAPTAPRATEGQAGVVKAVTPSTPEATAATNSGEETAKAKEETPVKMKAVYVGKGMKLHKGIKDAKSCLVCHEHHAANSKVLVHADIKKPCLSCHNEEIKVDKATVITNIKKEIDGAKSVHGPVADGRCLHCHKGHASEHRDLLSQGHTERLYAEYAKDSYELCFTCHDRSIAEDKTSTATNFRDKDNNLHYLHIRDEGIKSGSVVGKKKVKGRTCNVCHDMHAGPQKSLIRPDLPYGKGGWKLKIDFKQTPIGGSCTVACHKKKDYRHASTPSGVDKSWKDRVKKSMLEKGLR